MVAPGATVTAPPPTLASCTVSGFTVTPAPNLATLAPAKWVAPPEIRTSSVVPALPVLGLTERIAGADGAAITWRAPMPVAVSVEPSPRSW